MQLTFAINKEFQIKIDR